MHPTKKQYVPPLQSSAARILIRLKTHGMQTSAELGSVLAISSEAVRQQLQKLVRDGLVRSESRARGVGRPALMWDLTPEAQQRFPDQHSALAARLLDGIRQALGEAALEEVLAVRHEENRKSYLQSMAGLTELEQRLAQLASMRTREGYMSEVEPQGAGTWLLVENHCPIRVAAAACAGFCKAELTLFREVLGADVEIERVEHMQEGARRCAYRIEASTILAEATASGPSAAKSSSAVAKKYVLSKQSSRYRL